MLRKIVLKIWEKERGDTPFIIFFSFTISLFVARMWVILTKAHEIEKIYEGITVIGSNLIIGGFHIHHITYGVILLSVAGLMSIYYTDKTFLRISAVFYGVGLGLIVDELGLIVEGLSLYPPDNLFPAHIVAILVGGLIGMFVYFPSFRNELKKEKIKFKF